MDTDTDQTSATEQTTTSPEVSTSTTDTSSNLSSDGDTSSDSSGDEATSDVLAPPAYTPDFKLKVYDEEKELDDPFLKALIKDADSEKKVKEIAQKYLGFDTVKERHEKTKSDFQGYMQTTQPVVEYYNKASKMLQQGDLSSFFEFLKIPDDAIFKFAVAKAEEAQLSPEQRQFLHNQRQVWKDKMGLEEQNQSLQSSQQKQLSEFRAQELNWVMARPDVNNIAQAYDSKVGTKGAFRQLVIDKGLAHFAATKGDLSAEQSAMEVMKYIGVLVQPQGQMAQPGQTTNTTPLIPQSGQPPIIPNVTGRGTSPVKKQIRSIADLKKRGEELSTRSSG